MANLKVQDAENLIKEVYKIGAGSSTDPYKDPGTDLFNIEPVGSHTAQTIGASVVTLSPPTGATKLIFQARIQNLRITIDGTNPVAGTVSGVGFVILADAPPITIPIRTGTIIKIIEETSGARIQYQWAK